MKFTREHIWSVLRLAILAVALASAYVLWYRSRVLALGLAGFAFDARLAVSNGTFHGGNTAGSSVLCTGIARTSGVAFLDSGKAIAATGANEYVRLEFRLGTAASCDVVLEVAAGSRPPGAFASYSVGGASGGGAHGYFADAHRGLVRLDLASRRDTVLPVPHHIWSLSAVAVAGGVAYVTDASWKFRPADETLEYLESRAHGRLVAFRFANQSSAVLLTRDLHYPTGVAVERDAATGEAVSVLVSEQHYARIKRVWLRGSQAGRFEVLASGLPCAPGGLALAGTGAGARLVVACVRPRNALFEHYVLQSRWLCQLLAIAPPLAAWLRDATDDAPHAALTLLVLDPAAPQAGARAYDLSGVAPAGLRSGAVHLSLARGGGPLAVALPHGDAVLVLERSALGLPAD